MSTPTTNAAYRALEVRGINYDVGTDYGASPTRTHWDLAAARRDLEVIRDELHCTTVNLYGRAPHRIAESAAAALDLGLGVWVQPRLIDHHTDATLDHLTEMAGLTEELRAGHPPTCALVLNIGCEWSLFSNGIIPGRDHATRAAALAKPYRWPAVPLYNRRLNQVLRVGLDRARRRFRGPITYSAGLWERVDWSGFDLVGLNYYRMRWNRARYEQRLRRQHRHRKPVVVTEFGCGAFTGAGDLGPTSHTITVDTPAGPRVPGGHPRDEQVQATYLADQLAAYLRAGIHGAFVFEFIEPYKPTSPDPAHDLDRTGYGIVAPDVDATGTDRWQPKAAFHEVARIYGQLAHEEPTRCPHPMLRDFPDAPRGFRGGHVRRGAYEPGRHPHADDTADRGK
jgi:hypothetical protein